MKQTIIAMLLLLGAVFLFAQSAEATIQEMNGTVELKLPGKADWVPAKAGDRLEKSTIISTGFKSTAILAVGNSTMAVRPLTRLSLEALLLDRDNVETINVGLRTGRIQVNVNPPAGGRTNYTVQTPMATASVRGTEFFMDTQNIHVFEGIVQYKPTGMQAFARPVSVNAGQDTWIDSETGNAVNPVIAAETNRALPAMPGQAAAPAAEGSLKKSSSQGYFIVDVTLESE